MGIKGWFKVFGLSAITVKEKEFKGKCFGVDASYDIFRASLGMRSVHSLTDANGNPTIFINTLLSNVVRYKKLGVKGLIYVFDNPKPNPMKLNEHKKRNAAKAKAEKKFKDALRENADNLGKRVFKINDAIIADVKKMLSLLGVAWITAPYGYEAEHLGAELTKKNIIDSFITSDSDTLLFGGTSMVRRIKVGKKTCYEEYILSEVLVDYDINRDQLVHLGVVMGSDFNTKTQGIGEKTILKKGLKTTLNKEQKTAKAYFLKECPFTAGDIVNNADNTDKLALIEWLVTDKNFNRTRITKLLSKY
jgi:flap endonuclease-1